MLHRRRQLPRRRRSMTYGHHRGDGRSLLLQDRQPSRTAGRRPKACKSNQISALTWEPRLVLEWCGRAIIQLAEGSNCKSDGDARGCAYACALEEEANGHGQATGRVFVNVVNYTACIKTPPHLLPAPVGFSLGGLAVSEHPNKYQYCWQRALVLRFREEEKAEGYGLTQHALDSLSAAASLF